MIDEVLTVCPKIATQKEVEADARDQLNDYAFRLRRCLFDHEEDLREEYIHDQDSRREWMDIITELQEDTRPARDFLLKAHAAGHMDVVRECAPFLLCIERELYRAFCRVRESATDVDAIFGALDGVMHARIAAHYWVKELTEKTGAGRRVGIFVSQEQTESRVRRFEFFLEAMRKAIPLGDPTGICRPSRRLNLQKSRLEAFSEVGAVEQLWQTHLELHERADEVLSNLMSGSGQSPNHVSTGHTASVKLAAELACKHTRRRLRKLIA